MYVRPRTTHFFIKLFELFHTKISDLADLGNQSIRVLGFPQLRDVFYLGDFSGQKIFGSQKLPLSDLRHIIDIFVQGQYAGSDKRLLIQRSSSTLLV